MRQLAFDNYETTDDHGMHMTGVKDQTGKNITSLKIHGAQATTIAMVTSTFEAFVEYKTMDIICTKMKKNIKKKLGIK